MEKYGMGRGSLISDSTEAEISNWKMTLVYEGGPLNGDRTSEVLTTNPETVVVMLWGQRGRDGTQWGYTVAERKIDRQAGTAVLTLRWGALTGAAPVT